MEPFRRFWHPRVLPPSCKTNASPAHVQRHPPRVRGRQAVGGACIHLPPEIDAAQAVGPDALLHGDGARRSRRCAAGGAGRCPGCRRSGRCSGIGSRAGIAGIAKRGGSRAGGRALSCTCTGRSGTRCAAGRAGAGPTRCGPARRGPTRRGPARCRSATRSGASCTSSSASRSTSGIGSSACRRSSRSASCTGSRTRSAGSSARCTGSRAAGARTISTSTCAARACAGLTGIQAVIRHVRSPHIRMGRENGRKKSYQGGEKERGPQHRWSPFCCVECAKQSANNGVAQRELRLATSRASRQVASAVVATRSAARPSSRPPCARRDRVRRSLPPRRRPRRRWRASPP